MNAVVSNIEWSDVLVAVLWGAVLAAKFLAKTTLVVAWIVVGLTMTLVVLVVARRVPRFLRPKWL